MLEPQGDAIRFHPTLMALAAHYRFEPRPVEVARGNKKGRIERAIRYVRESFFAARQYADLDDLNTQAMDWCNGPAADRICPAARELRVGEAFLQEQLHLVPLPQNPSPTDEMVAVTVGKTPYVRFDLNDYSVPHTAVRRVLTVRATPERVRVLDGAALLAEHPRSYDRGAQIEDPAHIATLVAYKRQARQHRATNRLMQAAPASRELLVRAAARGSNLGSLTLGLMRLLERYGTTEPASRHRRNFGVRCTTPQRCTPDFGTPAGSTTAAAAARGRSPGARAGERCYRTTASARLLRQTHGNWR